jgi:hypothetical protein
MALDFNELMKMVLVNDSSYFNKEDSVIDRGKIVEKNKWQS